jgi:hypothetical protein
VDDEASLSLAAAAIGNRLSTLIGLWSYRILVVVAMLAFLDGLTLITTESFEWGKYFERAMGASLGLLLWGLHGAGSSALVALIVPGVCKSAFGRNFYSIILSVTSILNQSLIALIDSRSFISVPNGPAWGWW